MKVRVWWVGLAAIGLIALVVGLRVSGRRAGSGADPSFDPEGRDRLDDARRVRADRSNPGQESAGVNWPRTGPGLRPAAPEMPPSTLDASALAAEIEQQIEAIRASGPGSGALLRDAEAVSGPWEEIARASGKEIEVKPWECHRVGCFATAVHHSRQSVDDLTSKILGSAQLATWSGTKTQSAPIPKPNGTFEVTWLLYASPDASASP
jgi:hypothetical protein